MAASGPGRTRGENREHVWSGAGPNIMHHLVGARDGPTTGPDLAAVPRGATGSPASLVDVDPRARLLATRRASGRSRDGWRAPDRHAAACEALVDDGDVRRQAQARLPQAVAGASRPLWRKAPWRWARLGSRQQPGRRAQASRSGSGVQPRKAVGLWSPSARRRPGDQQVVRHWGAHRSKPRPLARSARGRRRGRCEMI